MAELHGSCGSHCEGKGWESFSTLEVKPGLAAAFCHAKRRLFINLPGASMGTKRGFRRVKPTQCFGCCKPRG